MALSFVSSIPGQELFFFSSYKVKKTKTPQYKSELLSVYPDCLQDKTTFMWLPVKHTIFT